jgi:hypothetical protein
MHAVAVPDADPATLKKPAEAAREIIAFLEEHVRAGRERTNPTAA